MVPKGGLLITGAPQSKVSDLGYRQLYNSIHAIDGTGTITGTYNKQHLVPFGEYVPLRWLFKFSKVTDGRIDFQPGETARIFDLTGLPPVAMLICYEVIFPEKIVEKNHRAAWILNLTNDAWFGNSAGPHQHLAAAQLRAIEKGLPVIRVANTGISAVIDAHGRIQASLPLGEMGFLDYGLPTALAVQPLYGRFGNKLFVVFILVCLILLWLPRLRRWNDLNK